MLKCLKSGSTGAQWAVPGKNQTETVEDILFLKNLLQLLGFLIYPWKFQTKQSFTARTPQNCVAPFGNFKAENQDPWKFHMIFS